MSGPRPTPEPAAAPDSAGDGTGDVIRWAAFSCVLVPVALLWYGTSLAGTTGTAPGLAADGGACRFPLRRSERGTAGPAPHGPGSPAARDGALTTARPAHRPAARTARTGVLPAARRDGRHSRRGAPVD